MSNIRATVAAPSSSTKIAGVVILGILALLFSVALYFRQYLTDLATAHIGDHGISRFTVGIALWILGGALADSAVKAIVFDRTLPRLIGHEPPRLLVNFSTAVIYCIAIGGCVVTLFDGSWSTLIATSSVVTVVVGFASRELILDFFCGIAIHIERPFRMGDWIEVQRDVVAKVVEINWRAVRLLTNSHKTIVIPNRAIAGNNIVNYSMPKPTYRENIKITLGNEHDPDRVVNILTAAILATPQVVRGAKHRVRIDGFNERGTIWALKYWVADYSDHIPAVHNVYANCIRYLHVAGIEIPYNRSELIMSGRSLAAVHDIARHRNNFVILRRIPLFEGLSDEEIQTIADGLCSHAFPADSVIVRQGDAGQSLFALVEGLLTATVDDQFVGTIQAGSVFGEMSLLTGEARKATVSAQTDVIVLEISAEQMKKIMTNRPRLVDDLVMTMTKNKAKNASAATASTVEKGEQSSLAMKIRQFLHLAVD